MTDELTQMAQEELNSACSLTWPELKRITPWGHASAQTVQKVHSPISMEGAFSLR